MALPSRHISGSAIPPSQSGGTLPGTHVPVLPIRETSNRRPLTSRHHPPSPPYTPSQFPPHDISHPRFLPCPWNPSAYQKSEVSPPPSAHHDNNHLRYHTSNSVYHTYSTSNTHPSRVGYDSLPNQHSTRAYEPSYPPTDRQPSMTSAYTAALLPASRGTCTEAHRYRDFELYPAPEPWEDDHEARHYSFSGASTGGHYFPPKAPRIRGLRTPRVVAYAEEVEEEQEEGGWLFGEMPEEKGRRQRALPPVRAGMFPDL